jgi:hypothetical protein
VTHGSRARRLWPWLWGSSVDVPREGGGGARAGDWGSSEARHGGQRARGWLARAQTGKREEGTGLAGGAEKKGVRAADSDEATAGAVTRGKTLGHPGQESKEGEEGIQPSDMAEGTRGVATVWGRSSERARRRGVGRLVSGEKGQRVRGRVGHAWNTWTSRGEGKKWVGPEGTGGFLIYSNKFQLARNVLLMGGPTRLQKFQIKYVRKEIEIRNNFSYRNVSRFEMEFELKFREASMS